MRRGSAASGYRAYFTCRTMTILSGRNGPVGSRGQQRAGRSRWGNEDIGPGPLAPAALAASAAPWKVVYFHHAPFSSGESHGSIVACVAVRGWGQCGLVGHDHHYERVMRDDDGDSVQMPYFVTGLGGQSIRPANRADPGGSVAKYSGGYGALFATATETSLSFEFRNTAGAIIDTYSMSKSGTVTPPPTEPPPPGKKPRKPRPNALEPRVCCN